MIDFALSDDQMKAVSSNARALVVIASAGSGKTEVVARRIERLLKESQEEDYRVLAVSYTVRSADELARRLRLRLGNMRRRVEADTVHSFALSLLRQHGTRIGLPTEPEILSRDEDRAELLASWLHESGQAYPEDIAAVLTQLDVARARRLTVPFLDEWRDALSANQALDYAAMLDRAIELLESTSLGQSLRRVYRHVVVDEAQNLTLAQYHLLTLIMGDATGDHLSGVFVGDERQSIVGFAGADRALIARFEDEYGAERIELRTNYRSAEAIAQVEQRVAKALDHPSNVHVEFPAPGRVSVKELPTESEEASYVADWVSTLLDDGLDPGIVPHGEPTLVLPEQIAVLGRSATSLRRTQEALADRSIEGAAASTPDDWVTSQAARAVLEVVAFKSAPDHRSTRRRLAELCLMEEGETWSELGDLLRTSPDPDVAALTPLASVGGLDEFVDRVVQLDISDGDWDDDVKQIHDAWESFLDRTNSSERTFANFRQHLSRCQRGDVMSPGVRLLTVHKSQGREFKAVAIVGCNEGQFPDFRATGAEGLAAELRTFYVAVTRPSRELLLTRPRRRQTRFGPRPSDRSSFIALLEGTTP